MPVKEIWRDVPGFEQHYQVSNYGRLRSRKRVGRNCNGKPWLDEWRTIKPIVCKNGYLEASFYINGKRTVMLLHRLVAKVFIPNPHRYPEVNHMDENIQNCRADNLEWCTSKYNANYGTRNERCRAKNRATNGKSVNQYTKDGLFLKRWECASDIGRECGFDISSIIRTCKHRQMTSYGYKWEYAS